MIVVEDMVSSDKLFWDSVYVWTYLTVHGRIKFKIATMTHKTIYIGNSRYSGTRHVNSTVCLCQPSVCYSL